MIVLLVILLILFLLYALSTAGRSGHPGWDALRGWSYAHRGLHTAQRPENSLSAFQAAVDKGYGIELDVHLMADGNLAVIHDSSLLRTVGADVKIEDLTLEQLQDYCLEGTQEPIPTFRQVLELVGDKIPMIVELKAVNNHAQLVDAACEMLKSHPGVYCIESFDPRCLYHLKKHYPHIIRGQLAENFLLVKGFMPWLLKWILTTQMANFLTRPDFTSYKFAHRRQFSNFLARKLWGVQGVSWTLTSLEEHSQAVKEGWIPIFENCEP